MIQKSVRVLAPLVFGASVFAAYAAVDISPPNLAGSLAGTIPGTPATGTDGSSQYSIDLPVPPGTNGVMPQVGLRYSSKSPADLSGVGWSLSGLSEITRCPSTPIPDGIDNARAVSLVATDQYCLDGERLILISGTLGATAEFRTEVESWSRVKSFGSNAAAGPDYWTVETKPG